MARTSHGIDRGGKWYFEVKFCSESPSGNIRYLAASLLVLIVVGKGLAGLKFWPKRKVPLDSTNLVTGSEIAMGI